MTWRAPTDLLALTERRPPLGGQGFVTRWGTTRAVWSPTDEGSASPVGRIAHTRCLELFAPALLDRLGVRGTQGYHKCGSGDLTDSATELRVRSWDGTGWSTLLEVSDLPALSPDDVRWFDLAGTRSLGAVIEVRRTVLDGVWTPWNVAEGGFVLEGRPSDQPFPGDERRLRLVAVDLGGMPDGVTGERLPGEVRLRTDTYQVGFRLGRPGFSFLGIDGEGTGRTDGNLLFGTPGVDLQGPMLHVVGRQPSIAPALRCVIDGEVEVRGNVVRYALDVDDGMQRLDLTWTALPDRLDLYVSSAVERDLEAWQSAVWQTGLDARMSAVATIGRLDRVGRTGTVELPLLLHAPGHGTIEIRSEGNGAAWRSDANRSEGHLTGELTVGHEPTDRGTTLIRAGVHEAGLSWVVGGPRAGLRPETPEPVRHAVRGALLTGLTFRPDTGTLSNNSISIHCPMTMDTWSAVAGEVARVAPEVPAVDLLRYSLERWLDGGPGYASGRRRVGGQIVDAEDDYLITGAGVLLGLADFLELTGDADWLGRYTPQIAHAIAQVRGRDLDGDGLIESDGRRGISGEHQWSTNWYDVVSFGWKDAWVNALLYSALAKFETVFPRLGAPRLADGIGDWRRRLAVSYRKTFLNPRTGWVAGWCSKDGVLHDYAFPAVNGAAITSGVLDEADARRVMENLWAELGTCEFDRSLGLPTCLWKIPDEDLTGFMTGYPHGFYLNGALSHSQSRHFVEALYAVGMRDEADALLTELCSGLVAGRAFSGLASGVDWRHWDGAPCGYEGLLTEQFGLVATALRRFGQEPAR